jgi:hypothetical protein
MIRTRFTNRPAALLTFDLDRFKSINDKFGTLPVTQCSSHFVSWRLRSYGRLICSAEWEVKSSRACRIRRGKTPSAWQSGCVLRSKPLATRSHIQSRSDRLGNEGCFDQQRGGVQASTSSAPQRIKRLIRNHI